MSIWRVTCGDLRDVQAEATGPAETVRLAMVRQRGAAVSVLVDTQTALRTDP